MVSMRKGGESLLNSCSHCGHRDGLKMEGRVEIFVYKGKTLIDHQDLKNIILFQGNGEIIRTLSTISPSTKPRIINRMAVGDQGTIPADPTVPKVPTKDLPQLIFTNGLYHEVYRKDCDSRIITINPGSTFNITGTLTIGSPLVTTATTTGLATGMTVVGIGIPPGTVIANINSSTVFTIGPLSAIAPGGAQTLTISGAANEAKFIATFNAIDVALTAFSNPSQPRINEVGLVIVDPTAPSGLVRTAVTAPTTPPVDEVVMSIRTFKSVPFEIANDVSITIRYTIFMN